MHFHKLNPLGSIFGKIWLSFWFSLILIVSAAYFVSVQQSQQYRIDAPTEEHIEILDTMQLPTVNFDSEDYARLAQTLAEFNSTSIYQWYLVDTNYRMLGAPQPPKRILVMLSEMMEGEGMQIGTWDTENWLGPIPITINGMSFLLFLRGIPPLSPANLPNWLDKKWMQLTLALIISGLMSLLLTWSLVRPIEKLRQSVRGLARGELDSRAGVSVSRRQDEIGELGRDFDDMATRLEDLVSAQQRLLSNVSHELRSPLTRLQVAMGIVRQKAPEGLDRALDRIERETDRLEHMIAQILKLSRFENDMHQADWQTLEVDDIIRKVVEDARFEAQPRNIKINDHILKGVRIKADAQLLHSTFDNVIRNALRFTPADGTITVTMTQTDNRLLVGISDQGPGVPEDKLERLFDPFYRLDQTNSGAGLGLNIALQAVQLHGGKIEAFNNKPTGLNVIIELPLNSVRGGGK
ncbi:ATP-binding protein [Reinekea marinisedimentorum]|uniref:histidine kinase n=1 Tax=Reinekea marinisedimentorum TaxID=230495 RepID=A0A4R3IEH8_9GAMM|nr:ATP-binding protein [Reinekea marinisedimentorum]TCS44008.1 two-component system sensor histidine kinase CpxA [Reinekea marinisedimentorum]